MNNIDEPIIVEQVFDNKIQDVWNAITELDKMIQWYFPNIPAFEPIVGFETRFVVQVEDRIYPHVWTVKDVIPNKKISYGWEYEGYPGKAISLFELIEENSQTKLRLTYIVIEKFPEDIPEFTRESGIAGWNYFIGKKLKEYLEKKN